jgi:Calcineurin-like phosphoesterase/Aldo/keto reductase family
LDTVLSPTSHSGGHPADGTVSRFAVLSDIHLSPAGTADGTWNNATRRSVSSQLLQAAVDEIAAAGHHHVLVLGDISDDGSPELIGAALSAITAAGLEAWAVPGNHDAAQDAHALDIAAGRVSGSAALYNRPVRASELITLAGSALTSNDGGQMCEATNLPDVTAITSQILLWAGHYPLISQQAALQAAGLRYPGDLRNLREARDAADQHAGPIVVLHGHLHTVITALDGRLLQLGFPALVEWPHAWTDLRIETAPGGTAVRTAVRPVAGNWSECTRNAVLASRAQTWQLDGGRWRAATGTRAGPDGPRSSRHHPG